ncbi:MAG: T9SS type A sorting domain-containing protein [Chitinophagales bacterium]|nr:T9SS type A sorting domain-containing protein [Chitinophagales bacterium]
MIKSHSSCCLLLVLFCSFIFPKPALAQTNPVALRPDVQVEFVKDVPAYCSRIAIDPVADRTTVDFFLTEKSSVIITLMDVQGRIIRTLINAPYEAGAQSISVTMNDLAEGIYFMQLETGSHSVMCKVIAA